MSSVEFHPSRTAAIQSICAPDSGIHAVAAFMTATVRSASANVPGSLLRVLIPTPFPVHGIMALSGEGQGEQGTRCDPE